MPVLRLLVIIVALVTFFLIGVPVQRLIMRRMPRAADRIPVFFCRSMLRLAKVRVDIHGHPADAPAVLASNHVSWIDILALGSVTPFCFLAKREIASWPVVSAFASVQGTVFVERRRWRSIPSANRQLADRMRAGRVALLFPEGTTIAGPVPGRFLSSHFEAARHVLDADPSRVRVMVQPVAIAYSSELAAWVGDDDLFAHLWRTLRSPPLRCRVQFGFPIPFDASTSRKDVAIATRTAVVAMLGGAPAAADGVSQSLVEPSPPSCCAPS